METSIYDYYQFIAKIGEGANGNVFKARDKITNKIVTIKEIHIGKSSFNKDSYKEIQNLQLVHNNNIISLINHFYDTDLKNLFLIYDYFPYDLSYLTNPKKNISMAHIKAFIYQIANGLAALHQAHIIHRDLKPSNIFISKDSHLVIGDFGLSCHLSPDSHDQLSPQVGTTHYMAPEMLFAVNNYSYSIDIWSFGCIIYQLLTKKCLFDGISTTSQIQEIINICGPIPNSLLSKWEKSSYPIFTHFSGKILFFYSRLFKCTNSNFI